MTTVAIIGAGDIGGACAHALALGDRAGNIVVVDKVASVAAGKALDIRQSGAIEYETPPSWTRCVTIC